MKLEDSVKKHICHKCSVYTAGYARELCGRSEAVTKGDILDLMEWIDNKFREIKEWTW